MRQGANTPHNCRVAALRGKLQRATIGLGTMQEHSKGTCSALGHHCGALRHVRKLCRLLCQPTWLL